MALDHTLAVLIRNDPFSIMRLLIKKSNNLDISSKGEGNGVMLSHSTYHKQASEHVRVVVFHI